MARIRTIKPEFWGDEKLAPMDALTRLVFLGIVSFADDAGRLLDSVKMIDGLLFAHTNDTSRESLANLSRAGRIERGITASGQCIIQIVNWHHQKIDHPNLKAALPPIAQRLTEDSRAIREPFATDSRAASDSISTSYQLPATNDRSSATRKRGKGEPKPAKPAPPEKPPSWVVEGAAWWTENVGAITHGRVGKALKSVVDARTWPVVFPGLKCYVSCMGPTGADRQVKLEFFAADANRWIEWSTMKGTDPVTGDDTPLGLWLQENIRPRLAS